ncbi:MAG: hypothetical protein ACYDA4_15030 [Ignavibacteriaceae bacterium]
MYPQINIPAQSIQNIILEERIFKTFQKNKSKHKLLEYGSIKTKMNYAHIANLRDVVKSP